MFAWLGAKALFGLSRWMWVAGAVAALIGAVAWLQARENADDKANQEIGATVQREGDLRETIKRVETADDVRDEMQQPSPAGARLRYDQCLRSARTPANCERLLPGGSAANR